MSTLKGRIAKLEQATIPKQGGMVIYCVDEDGMVWVDGERMSHDEFEKRYDGAGVLIRDDDDPGPFRRELERRGELRGRVFLEVDV